MWAKPKSKVQTSPFSKKNSFCKTVGRIFLGWKRNFHLLEWGKNGFLCLRLTIVCVKKKVNCIKERCLLSNVAYWSITQNLSLALLADCLQGRVWRSAHASAGSLSSCSSPQIFSCLRFWNSHPPPPLTLRALLSWLPVSWDFFLLWLWKAP